MATPHWATPTMAGTDAAATIDDTFDSAMVAIDDHAKIVFDTFANRGTPAARKAGFLFSPTDQAGFVYLSDGTNWIEVAPGMGSVPVGASLDWWSTVDPGDTRFVKMDGRALSTTTYAVLYALLGNAYDTLDGQTAPGAGLFRIPRSFGRTTIQAGTGTGLTPRTLGQLVGEEGHALSTAELAAHSHSGSADPGGGHSHGGVTTSDGNHLHGLSSGSLISTTNHGEGEYLLTGGPYSTSLWVVSTVGAAGVHYHGIPAEGNHTHWLTVNSTGSGAAHNTMQPSLVCNRIMRIA